MSRFRQKITDVNNRKKVEILTNFMVNFEISFEIYIRKNFKISPKIRI